MQLPTALPGGIDPQTASLFYLLYIGNFATPVKRHEPPRDGRRPAMLPGTVTNPWLGFMSVSPWADRLIQADRYWTVREMTTAAAAKKIADDANGLIALPEVVLRINELVENEEVSANELAAVISQDPALAMRLLKYANSPLYGASKQIDTIARAVTILGTSQIRDIALSTMAAHAFNGIPVDVISVEAFWHHSLYCALLAKELGKARGGVNTEALFTAGLMHDIGQLIIFHRMPDKAHETIMRMVQGDPPLTSFDAEREVLGFDHMQVGAELAQAWHMPGLLTCAIAYHHHPAEAQEYRAETAIIHIANAIASLPYSDTPGEADLQRVEQGAWEQAGLKPEQLGPCVRAAQAQINETMQLLFSKEGL